MLNKDRGLTSIVALHNASEEEMLLWSESYGADTVLLRDHEESVFDTYKRSNIRPQCVLIDKDLTIHYKSDLPEARVEAQRLALELLE